MSERSVARRYATALFEVARSSGLTERAGDELRSLVHVIDGHAELTKVLGSPAIPAGVKKQILKGVIDAAGTLSAEVTRLVLMLAERDRVGLLRELESAYAARLLEEKKIVPAEIVTAAPLSDASRAALTKALGSATGRDVTLTERVDSSIVGGVVARVGSLVFDGSITRQLERLRQKLATNN